MDYQPMLETALRAAREAGAMAKASSGKPLYQQWKAGRDLVVGSTLPIQQRIIEIIRTDFPNHAILAEESDAPPPADSNPLWIVDPIDGSMNFLQGIPHVAISIAYREDGFCRVGVVYDPFTDELFQAVQGRFARLNDHSITVQQISEGEDATIQAIVATDLPAGMKERQQNLNIATLMAVHCTALTIMGSPALGLCYVAAGRLHGYFGLDLKLWDVAAASVILSESKYPDDPWRLHSRRLRPHRTAIAHCSCARIPG